MTHRSRLMRAVRECGCACGSAECSRKMAEFRARVIEVACDLEESTRDTIPCPAPDYPGELADAAPPTPTTLRTVGLVDLGGVL